MRSRFVVSAAAPSDFPDHGRPEFAFLGRSNVGKSSLLNRVAAAKVAHTSKTPGRTQLINFFEVHAGEADYMLADLPGYGFARVPRRVQISWAPLIESYLEARPQLKVALLLLDIRRELRPDDLELAAYLAEVLPSRGAWLELVVTKADKLPKSKQIPALAKLSRALSLPRERAHLCSAESGQGIQALRSRLETLSQAAKASVEPD